MMSFLILSDAKSDANNIINHFLLLLLVSEFNSVDLIFAHYFTIYLF